MVLNFIQLKNTTHFSFDLHNTENYNDDYRVGPNDQTSHHDMWLAQGSGYKGVSIYAYADGSAVTPLLYMWDENWAIRYRVGGHTEIRSVAVNGSKDFSIHVYDDYLVFVCHNGTFDGSTSQARLDDWKDWVLNNFSTPLRYGTPEVGEATIQVARLAQRQQIIDLVLKWVADYLEHGRGQGTIVTDGTPNGWRIELQDNGAMQRDGLHYYNLTVQFNGGCDNVYAHIMLPVGYRIGRTRIRNAFMLSMDNCSIAVITPPTEQRAREVLGRFDYRSPHARTSWAVQSLTWQCALGNRLYQ